MVGDHLWRDGHPDIGPIREVLHRKAIVQVACRSRSKTCHSNHDIRMVYLDKPSLTSGL